MSNFISVVGQPVVNIDNISYFMKGKLLENHTIYFKCNGSSVEWIFEGQEERDLAYSELHRAVMKG